VSVLAELTGLAVATTYHYRVSCSNVWVTAVGADATFTTDPTDLLQQKGLIYGSEIGGWLTGGSPATDASTGIPGKVVAAGVPVIRYEARDCFTDEVCGRDHHMGTLSRSAFDYAIVAITSSMHAIPFIKLLPVSKAGSTFCPDKNADLTLANPTLNLPNYESMLAEIANGVGYHGPIIIESSNEMEYDCAAHWFGAGASAGLAGVSTLIGQHYAANMPALIKYARDTLHFSQVVSVGYIGVSGGGYGSTTNGWGANCTASATAPYGYACGYRVRAMTEFSNAVLAAYNSNGHDPDYIPDVESIHAYCHSTDFLPTSFTGNPYDFDDNVCYAFYRSWLVKSRAYVNSIWGSTIGNNIRFSISEWQAGTCATTTNCWTGFSSPSAVQSYYDGWYRMLRGDGNTTGTGTRYWSGERLRHRVVHRHPIPTGSTTSCGRTARRRPGTTRSGRCRLSIRCDDLGSWEATESEGAGPLRSRAHLDLVQAPLPQPVGHGTRPSERRSLRSGRAQKICNPLTRDTSSAKIAIQSGHVSEVTPGGCRSS